MRCLLIYRDLQDYCGMVNAPCSSEKEKDNAYRVLVRKSLAKWSAGRLRSIQWIEYF
jgi:hypothetical protein